jgi:hypothetical protein
MLETEIIFKFKTGAGDPSLALRDDNLLYCLGERSGDSLKYRRGPKQSLRIATSFPPLPHSRYVIPS